MKKIILILGIVFLYSCNNPLVIPKNGEVGTVTDISRSNNGYAKYTILNMKKSKYYIIYMKAGVYNVNDTVILKTIK